MLKSLNLMKCQGDVACNLSFNAVYIFLQEKHAQFLQSIHHRLNQNLLRSRHLTLQLIKTISQLPPEVTGETVPLFVGALNQQLVEKLPFDLDLYGHHLSTKVLGQTVIYAEVMPTTMTIVDRLVDFSTH